MPKVASSSISQAILPYLPNKTEVKSYPFVHAEVWDRVRRPTYEDFKVGQDLIPTFLITRHPLTRLVSAYRDKLEPGKRKNDSFMRYGKIISTKVRGSWEAGDPDPTFYEFIKYLIKTPVESYNEHWMPISLRCRVCHLSYDYILHYEDLQSDWALLLKDLNITEDISLPWENKGGGDITNYYQNISREDMDRLYQKYEADFLMFGYSVSV